MSPAYLFKVVTVGSAQVGKTSMILRYTTGRFREYYAPTLGADFAVKKMDLDGDRVKVQVWDLGGQDFLGSVRAGFYPGARGVIFLFDVTRPETLTELNDWKNEVDSHIRNYTSLLVANKTDLEEERAVSEKEGRKFAKNLGSEYYETSVKLNQNVSDAFEAITKQVLEKMKDA
jgi:small GTP-binding protein